jgi:hypothetical protein
MAVVGGGDVAGEKRNNQIEATAVVVGTVGAEIDVGEVRAKGKISGWQMMQGNQAAEDAMGGCYIMRNFGTYFTGTYVFLLVPCESACCTILLGIKIPVLEIQSRC